MKLLLQFLIVILCSCFYLSSHAQSPAKDMKDARQMVNKEQKSFRDFIKVAVLNSKNKITLKKFVINHVNTLQNNLQFFVTAPKEKRIKAIRSLYYFMKELEEELTNKRINEADIPIVLTKYREILTDFLNQKNSDHSIEADLKDVPWRLCQSLANSFWELDDKKQIADFSACKRVIETPEYIFSFLESQPKFYYSDTLIIFMAKNYPNDLLSYVQKNNNPVTKNIFALKNIYVQQLLSFSSNSQASEVAPFTEQILNNELIVDSILEKRKNIDAYFQLLVNTQMENVQKEEEGADPEFEIPLYNALSEKSLDFYVKKINELHTSRDEVRFQSVKSLRPEDLYYIIVTADQEMYTSTYLGLYKRLLSLFKNTTADSLLNLVQLDHFRTFMRIAGTYNTLLDFLQHMPQQKSRQLIHLFITGIDAKTEDEAIGNATDIADAFINLSKDSSFNELVKEEIESNLETSKRDKHTQSIRLYSILLQVYNIVNEHTATDFSSNYKKIPIASLQDKGTINELVLFYGDEDGKNSYNSFMDLFKNKTKWSVTEHDSSWITISSLQGQPVHIYANFPLDNENEDDIAAQQSLVTYLQKQSIEPSILIHRGHSYHLANTLKYLTPSIKLAILGSCGGYKNMKKIIELNPEVHIIASKQTGSMIVNDPLLNQLNNYLVQGKNIDWVIFWNELNETFKKNPNASKLFEEYVPPYKNVSSYVIRLYKYGDNELNDKP
jgi:hypothetical protein